MAQEQFSPKRRPGGVSVALAGGFLIQAGLLALLLARGRIGTLAAIGAATIYGVAAATIWYRAAGPRFGVANTVTTLRGGMIAVLPALILAPGGVDPVTAWAVVFFGALALALDGLDGKLARRLGESSAFGAHFDMEVDAAFVLFLSGVVAATGRAGLWVLLTGLMRYLWVAAGMIWPLLREPLPPSLFRKSVCVILLLLLLFAMAPVRLPGGAALPCVAGLVLLLASFGRDLLWLMRKTGGAIPRRVEAVIDDGAVPVESE
jgi:phosphatidylglycerophosphate synthase